MKGVGVRHSLSCLTIQRARRSTAAVGLLLLGTLAACGGDGTTEPGRPTTPVGAYAISTVNGKALPVSLFADGGFNYEVMSGKLTLTNDGKYSAVTTFRQTLPGNVETFVDSVGGTWVLAGTTVSMTNPSDGSSGSAAWGNGTLTISATDAGVTTTFVYGLKK
jgi:hypothetical protein